jgi:3-hydroxyisobutyrate dehydrogenase-like beta-hydroxyacid dehydrogenase
LTDLTKSLVSILGGGAKAEYAASVLNPLGMSITPVSGETGRASATKLCRSNRARA